MGDRSPDQPSSSMHAKTAVHAVEKRGMFGGVKQGGEDCG